MKKFSFTLEFGIGYPYPAHFTIGMCGHTLWFCISTSTWNKIQARKKRDRFRPAGACLSIFTVTYTN